MGKARVKSEVRVVTWDQVDDLVQRCGELTARIGELNRELTKSVADAKATYKGRVAAVERELADIYGGIQVFVTQNRSELRGRSKRLNHGKIGYRKSTHVRLKAKSADVLEQLEALGLDGCIKVKKTVDRNALRNLEPAVLKRLGAELLVEDVFFVEPDRVEVKAV
jgi:phage host-nuclease inhibitor protein Gam